MTQCMHFIHTGFSTSLKGFILVSYQRPRRKGIDDRQRGEHPPRALAAVLTEQPDDSRP